MPIKNFPRSQNKIFGPVQYSTGIEGPTDQMLPLIPPNYPKVPALDILQEYKSFLAVLDHFWTFWGYCWTDRGMLPLKNCLNLWFWLVTLYLSV